MQYGQVIAGTSEAAIDTLTLNPLKVIPTGTVIEACVTAGATASNVGPFEVSDSKGNTWTVLPQPDSALVASGTLQTAMLRCTVTTQLVPADTITILHRDAASTATPKALKTCPNWTVVGVAFDDGGTVNASGTSSLSSASAAVSVTTTAAATQARQRLTLALGWSGASNTPTLPAGWQGVMQSVGTSAVRWSMIAWAYIDTPVDVRTATATLTSSSRQAAILVAANVPAQPAQVVTPSAVTLVTGTAVGTATGLAALADHDPRTLVESSANPADAVLARCHVSLARPADLATLCVYIYAADHETASSGSVKVVLTNTEGGTALGTPTTVTLTGEPTDYTVTPNADARNAVADYSSFWVELRGTGA